MAMEVGSFDSFVGELVRGNEKVDGVVVEEVGDRLGGGCELDKYQCHGFDLQLIPNCRQSWRLHSPFVEGGGHILEP